MRRQFLWLAASLFALSAQAAEPAPAPSAQPAPQSGTKAWLELQSSGRAASQQRQTLSGPAMDKVHERHIKSFTAPIPAQYEHAENLSK